MDKFEHTEFYPGKKGEVLAHEITYDWKKGKRRGVELLLGGEREDRRFGVVFYREHLPALEKAVAILRKAEGKKPRRGKR